MGSAFMNMQCRDFCGTSMFLVVEMQKMLHEYVNKVHESSITNGNKDAGQRLLKP